MPSIAHIIPAPRPAGRRAAAALLLALLAAAPAWAQFPVLGEDGFPKILATIDARIEPERARPGENVRLLVTAKIAKGWYLYSLQPQEGEFAPPPTTLSVAPGGLALVGPPYETNPTQKQDAAFNLNLAVHPGAVRFYQNLQVPRNRPAGSAPVTAELRYQVCNNRLCTPPRTQSLAAPLAVEGGPVRPAYASLLRTIDFIDREGNLRFSADSLDSVIAGGLWSFLLLAAGFGALALLTPCVFPMIPVTVSFFASASREGGSALRLALLFAAGIVATSTGLGLALTVLLGAGGVARFAASPWVNMAVGGAFALFALNLMGLYGMSLPSGLVQRLNLASYRVKGPVGVLLMGIAFTATSFTCTMPFVGTLLVAATQGQVFWPVLGMVVFSAVFSLPFFLLALFPQWVVSLRGASGNWMVQVKVVLGLLEMMAALKFLSNADLIWQWGALTRETVLAAWAVLALAAALVLLGLMPWPGINVLDRRPVRLGFASALLALAIYLALGAFGRSLDAYTESYAPPDVSGRPLARAVAGAGDRLPAAEVELLPWHPLLAPALLQARQTGKPLFVDFTGYTCINCRWMERNIFAERRVHDMLRDRFALARLYTDGGPHGDRNQTLQIERFRTIALPYYVVVGPDDSLLAKHAGIVETAEEFLVFLNGGAQALAAATAKPGAPPSAR
jgi:thiol:disulfide interchange protein DsbD